MSDAKGVEVELRSVEREAFGFLKMRSIEYICIPRQTLTDWAERLSPGETWPKWFVSPNFSVRPDDGWSAFWKWDSPDPSEAEYCLVDGTLGKGSPTSFGWEKEYQIKVTEAEAKAHVRPEPPKGKKLTGEFRVPNRGETYVRVDGGTSGIRCLENEHPADSLVSFNGDKRWLTIDDNTCPTCHGKGTV